MNSNRPTIKIILIDDRSAIHIAIEQVLSMEDDIQLIAHGNSGQEAIELCDTYHPDVVLMDVIMPGMNGIEATRAILDEHPKIKILALSSFQDQEAVKGILEAGAVGYVLKTADALTETLIDTIRDVYNGKSVLSPTILTMLLQPPPSKQTELPPNYGLTRRELEILRYMAEGKNNTEIADTLTVSLSTIKHHVSSILSKLNATTRTEAVSLAVKQKLVN
ncbi:MAG: response regulator transcription factor [Chitinophagaceae bacterium]|nr:response regulator transcription factor [Anaerolineae bacterium]